MNGDRSNHQGRVKVAEKAAPPPVVQRATLPPAFQKLHATMCHSERPRCHSERSEESRPGSYFRITSSPAQAADLPERRARFLAALGMTHRCVKFLESRRQSRFFRVFDATLVV